MIKNNQDDALVDLIFNFGRIMKGQIGSANSVNSFSMLQFKALYFISQSEKTSMTEVAGHFGVSSPSATSIVSKLFKLGYVKRSVGKADRRVINLIVTQNGKKAIESGMRKAKNRVKSILGVLSNDERKQLEKILDKIVSANVNI